MSNFQQATSVPFFIREEDGLLIAYAGNPSMPQEQLDAQVLLMARTELMNLVEPAEQAMAAFRALVQMLGKAMQGQVRAEVMRGLLDQPEGPTQ